MPPIHLRFYHTRFCPRCRWVARELRKLQKEYPQLEIEAIEVATNLRRAWQAGVRMIPTLEIGERSLSGILLTPNQVREFLAGAGETPPAANFL